MLVDSRKRRIIRKLDTLCAGCRGGVGSKTVNFSGCSFQTCTQVNAGKGMSSYLSEENMVDCQWNLEVVRCETSPSMRITDVFLMN